MSINWRRAVSQTAKPKTITTALTTLPRTAPQAFLRKPRRMSRVISRSVAALLLLIACSSGANENTASALFETRKSAVYQIRVIDIASGDKYSIGSGFQISPEGHIGTNFHVVSAFVHQPEKYRLEYTRQDGETLPVELLLTDVVHDLALLRTDDPAAETLSLATQELGKGDRIYSMGNPHDLGMTIIEGTYNGLVENSRFKKILFSGSLNAGMSGGPALNSQGEVMGINVSKGGEQISFLVPVTHLQALLEEGSQLAISAVHHDRIRKALIAEQNRFYQQILESTPESKQLGSLTIPGQLSDTMRCWGHSVDEDEKEKQYTAAHQHCRTEDYIYVRSELYIGEFSYDFELIETQELNRFQFYTLLQEQFSHRGFYNTGDKEQVSNFACHDKLVQIHDHRWKISTCMRAYKEYEGLFDASMSMVSMDFKDKAGVATVRATGVSAENAVRVFQHIAESVQWNR